MSVPAQSARIDPVTFEVITNALDSIADQAAIALFRSAYSAIVRDSLDYSTAVFDAKGRMLSQGLTTALHIGSFPDAMANLLEVHGSSMRDGDIFICNDPYSARGMHLPDVYVIKPVFVTDRLLGFVTTLTHMADIGGITPGSNPVHSTEIFQEGLRIPLLKLHDAGVPNETVLAIIAQNTRLPVKVLGDLRAQVAGCVVAERSFLALADRYGIEQLETYFQAMIDYSERVMRSVLSAVPDGCYEFTDYIDGLGEEPVPIVFHVAVTIAGSEMTVDWTGTSPQVKAGINAPLPNTKAATALAARLLVRQPLPNCVGYMLPLRTIAPEGTIVNPREPAGCATRGITAMRMLDTLLGALAQAVPDRIPACTGGDNYWPTIGGYHERNAFAYVESIMGTWGGRPNRDGAEGAPHPGGNQPNQPIEMVETRHPLQVTRYGLVENTGGAGLNRGGLALEREYRVRTEEAILTIRTDRRRHLPYGLNGGDPGTPAWNILNPGSDRERILPTLPMEAIELREGDVLRIQTAGGGGWGDPLDRDPQRVLEDVIDEKLDSERAMRCYGVVIDPARQSIDQQATNGLRSTMRANRRSAGHNRGEVEQ
jgi:N-methylhydantoinase B